MKTALFVPTYLEGTDYFGNSRMERQKRYLKWYDEISSNLGIDDVFMSDNGSSDKSILELEAFTDHFIMRDKIHLVGGGHVRYPYCWRHLYNMKHLLDGYDKIIMIDTDAFIVSRKLSTFIKDLSSGWVSFQERRWNIPTAELHVLCKDAFWIYKEFCGVPYMSHMGKMMEVALPFTDIRHEFHCERSGESHKPQEEGQDLYAQASLTTPLAYK